MLELRWASGAAGPSTWNMGAAGDAYNTAVYLNRWGADDLEVRFASVVGTSTLSGTLLSHWSGEGLTSDWCEVVEGANPALYVVMVDAYGERTFCYYRSESPVRVLLDDERHSRVGAALSGADVVFISGITLSLLTAAARARLLALVDDARSSGATIAFDPNYRPAGWPSIGTARSVLVETLGHVDVALPTLADEVLLHGGGTAEEVGARYAGCGVREVVVKLGAGGVWVSDAIGPGTVVTPPAPLAAVDTTGAGDAFNAAYLWSRMHGLDRLSAAAHGHRLAGAVVMSSGAILPPAAMPARPDYRVTSGRTWV